MVLRSPGCVFLLVSALACLVGFYRRCRRHLKTLDADGSSMFPFPTPGPEHIVQLIGFWRADDSFETNPTYAKEWSQIFGELPPPQVAASHEGPLSEDHARDIERNLTVFRWVLPALLCPDKTPSALTNRFLLISS